jgi:hypothetical protein
MTDEYRELTPEDLAYRWRERTVLESLEDALGEAVPTDEYATPDSALRWLLQLAWHDLQTARGQAINGRWSINCDGQVSRIVGLTGLVGPVPWEVVSVDLIIDGIYERIHEAIGTPTPLSDSDRRRAQAVRDRRTT